MKQNISCTWFLALLLWHVNAAAQEAVPPVKTADNTLAVELGGKGLLYTVYYERMLLPELSATVGFSSWHLTFFVESSLTFIPVFLTYYTPGTNSHLYIDGGIDIISITDIRAFDMWTAERATGVIGVAGLGYCYRAADGGLFFKIGPMFLLAGGIHPWGNLTLGLTF